MLEAVRQLTGKYDRELADSVLEVSIQANEQIIEELMIKIKQMKLWELAGMGRLLSHLF